MSIYEECMSYAKRSGKSLIQVASEIENSHPVVARRIKREIERKRENPVIANNPYHKVHFVRGKAMVTLPASDYYKMIEDLAKAKTRRGL